MERNEPSIHKAHEQLERLQQTHQVPASLSATIMQRLEQREAYLAAQKSYTELAADLHHPDWEQRSIAVQALGAQASLAELGAALQDDHSLVRLAAVAALGQYGRPVPRDLLLVALHDRDWQVREMALLMLARMTHPLPERKALLLVALEDANAEVRSAAAFVLHQLGEDVLDQSLQDDVTPVMSQSMQERTHTSMAMTSQQNPSTHDDGDIQVTAQPPVALVERKLRRLHWKLRYALFAAALLVLVVALSATALNWWDPLFGKPDQYQAIGQSQTQHGATITVTRAYADRGRTIVAYDISYTDRSKQLFVMVSDLHSPYPQVPGVLSGTPCSAMQSDGVTHCYFTTQAFQVPDNVNSLTLTWDVMRLLVVQPGAANQPKDATIDGQWHFVFTIPFHHESDNLPAPPGGYIYH